MEVFMSKFLEILKDVLSVAMAVMLLFYIVKYRGCIDRIVELERENSILKRYLWQNLKKSTDYDFDGKQYAIKLFLEQYLFT